MGKKFSKIFKNRELRILMLGLDSAGKTTILYKLKLGSANNTSIPTVGFNVESVKVDRVKFNVWDVGGQDKIRPLWRHYFTGTQGLVFVIDSSDSARLNEAKSELLRIISDREMANATILVFANKQDIANALTPNQINEFLELGQLRNPERVYHVMGSVASTAEGIFEGLKWLETNIKN